MDEIIRKTRELSLTGGTYKELSKEIDKNLIPDEKEKKNNSEISTPHKLRNEMLDKIPAEFWTTPKKVFEPCSGKGGFLVDILDRFMVGLKDSIPDEKLRYKTIVEDCLYFSDINAANIEICKTLLDPKGEHVLKYNAGDTLELKIKEKWNIDGFDAIIGNPPYGARNSPGKGNAIWQKFVRFSLKVILKDSGYLVFVHPSVWRKPYIEKGRSVDLFKLMTADNQMIYLSIHGIKDGRTIFKCGTRYDWYVIQRIAKNDTTIVRDEKGIEDVLDLSDFSWLPNYNIRINRGYLSNNAHDRFPVLGRGSEHNSLRKRNNNRWSREKTDVYKHICVNKFINGKPDIVYIIDNRKGFFGIPKIMFGRSGIRGFVIDLDGQYIMSDTVIAFRLDDDVRNIDTANQIIKAFESPAMKVYVDSCSYATFGIDWQIFRDLKKDFWKEFI